MGSKPKSTQTGGREATTGVIPGDYALSVGNPQTPTPEGWKWTRLTELSRLESGHTPSRKHPEYWNGDIPWIGIRDATGNHGKTIQDTAQHTNALGIENSSARLLPANTVCLSRTASVGYVIVAGREMATSQDFVNWVCDPERLDYQFLKYVLLAERRSFLRFAHGTTHQTIYFPEVKAFHICTPEINVQRVIAHILGSLDDKIELNRQMNRTLEKMAQAVFKSWFIDFDPVHAKAEGRDTGLPSEIADLFPDGFEDSELGEIPKSWIVCSLEDATITILDHRGKTPKKLRGDWAASGIPAISAKNIKSGRIVNRDRMKYVDEGLYRRWMKEELRLSDILMTSEAPIGELVYLALNSRYCLSQRVYGIRADISKSVASYLYLYLRSNVAQVEMQSRATGTTVVGIRQSELRRVRVILPPLDVQDAAAKLLDKILIRVAENEEESFTLGSLRDTLLPKLISGEVTIPDADKFLEDIE